MISYCFQPTKNGGPKKFSLCLNSKSMREKREGGKGNSQWRERTPLSRRGVLSHYCILPCPSFLFSHKLVEFKHKMNFFCPLWFEVKKIKFKPLKSPKRTFRFLSVLDSCNRGIQWFLISNVMKQGLAVIKKTPKKLVPGYLVQNPLRAEAPK